MAVRKAHFRFVTEKTVSVDNKRALAEMSIQHTRDAVAFANRSSVRLRETVRYATQLAQIEQRMLGTGVLEDDTEEREDLRLVTEALTQLRAAQRILEMVRLRTLSAALAVEEAVDPIFAPQADPKKPQEQPPALSMVLTETPSTPAPPEIPTVKPLVLDPDLLARARREIADRSDSREIQGNKL